MSHSRVITGREFLALLPGNGGPPPADAAYVTVTRSFLAEYGPQFRNWMIDQGLWKWSTKHDCDDKATLYRAVAGRVMVETPRWLDAESLEIAEIWYACDTGGAHAINAAVLDDRTVVFVEPQGPEFVTLSAQEQDSIFMRRI